VIGDNVTASHALLCEGVVVGSGATISPGVVLSYGVVVAPRHTVPAYAIVSLCKQITTEVTGKFKGGLAHQVKMATCCWGSYSVDTICGSSCMQG
jgi:tetrahydrodipicolinate N-succinyltransferase